MLTIWCHNPWRTPPFGIAQSANDQHVMVAGACLVPHLGVDS
jgi:hypothetical protein